MTLIDPDVVMLGGVADDPGVQGNVWSRVVRHGLVAGIGNSLGSETLVSVNSGAMLAIEGDEEFGSLSGAGDLDTSGNSAKIGYDGTDTVNSLYIDGALQTGGTWGGAGSGALIESGCFTGTGILQITSGATSSFDLWAGGFVGLTDADPELDFEGDGLDAGLEYVLAGDPTGMDHAAIVPTSSIDSSDLVFVFRRSDTAAADPRTTIVVEYGPDLAGWTAAVDDPGGTGVTISVEDDAVADGIDRVTVRIPRDMAAGGVMFARLKVTVIP